MKAFRASSEPPPTPPTASPVQKGAMRGRAVIAVVVIIVIAVGGIGYVVLTDSGASPANLLANGGFETGGLQGWQTVPPYVPTVESSTVAKGDSYAARFQTPTNDANVSTPCLTVGVGCNLLNTSTIYQNVYNLTVSKSTAFSLAVYPAFLYPSAFQVTLEFGLSSPAAGGLIVHSDVLVYYLVLASPQQCSTYSSDLLRTRPAGSGATHCLSAQQDEWTFFDRDLASDLPSGVSPSQLDRSMMTISVSFAGAGATDEAYVGSLYLG